MTRRQRPRFPETYPPDAPPLIERFTPDSRLIGMGPSGTDVGRSWRYMGGNLRWPARGFARAPKDDPRFACALHEHGAARLIDRDIALVTLLEDAVEVWRLPPFHSKPASPEPGVDPMTLRAGQKFLLRRPKGPSRLTVQIAGPPEALAVELNLGTPWSKVERWRKKACLVRAQAPLPLRSWWFPILSPRDEDEESALIASPWVLQKVDANYVAQWYVQARSLEALP